MNQQLSYSSAYNINGLEKLRGNPSYTTIAGLLLMEIETLIESGFRLNRGGIMNRAISYFRRFFSFSERFRIKGADMMFNKNR